MTKLTKKKKLIFLREMNYNEKKLNKTIKRKKKMKKHYISIKIDENSKMRNEKKNRKI